MRTEGEILAQAWDEKVLDIFDNEFDNVSLGGACRLCQTINKQTKFNCVAIAKGC